MGLCHHCDKLNSYQNGHDAIMVCMDKLSKMAHFLATLTIVPFKEMTRLFIIPFLEFIVSFISMSVIEITDFLISFGLHYVDN